MQFGKKSAFGEEEKRQANREEEDPDQLHLWGEQFADVKDVRERMQGEQRKHAKVDQRDLEELNDLLNQALNDRDPHPHIEDAQRLVYRLLR